MKPKLRIKILPQIVAAMLVPNLAFAVQPPQPETEVVSVTANKIEENIEDVPQSITVIDEFVLQDKGIKTIPDLIENIPNMNLSTNGGSNIGFRGLTQSVFTQNNPVVIYIDGVPTNKRYGFDASLANVERIEVLRGPQGTLYGKDAIGAVINVVTKKPENEWQGHIGAEVGSNNRRFVTFNANGAIQKDTLFLGINGQREQDDGWIDNTFPGLAGDANEMKDSKFGAFLLFTPNDRLSVKLNLARDKIENSWWDGYIIPAGAYTSLSDFKRDDAENASFDVPHVEEVTTDAQSLNIDYDVGAFTVTATTVHKDFEIDGIYDGDFSDAATSAGLTQYNNIDTETWSQEVRLASNNVTGMRWVAGLYYEDEDSFQGPYGYEYFFPGFGYFDDNSLSDMNNTNMAVFGQVMIPFANDFELTLGLRAQRYTAEIDGQLYTAFWPTLAGLASATPTLTNSYEGKETWDSILPKVALRYDVHDNFNVYASYSKGYMPGGFNTFAYSGGPDDNLFEPQSSDNFEIGIKGGTDNLTFAASVFYMDIKDIHVYRTVGPLYLTDNAEAAHSKGIELEFNWQATNNLEIAGSLGLISAKYDDYDNGIVDFSGDDIIETPSRTATLSVAYESPQNWYSRADIRHIGETSYFDGANNTNPKEDAYTTIDARLGYRVNDFDIYVFGKNLTDEEYVNGFMASTIVGGIATFGDPRTFGAGVRYDF